MLGIGAHVDSCDPIAEAAARRADLVQFFLGDPQGWKGPRVDYPGGPAALREAAAAAGLTLYVHAPYVINVATTNNRIRIPSRKLLAQHLQAAAELGAAGLIVHGGHVLKGDEPEIGVENWRKTFQRMDCPIPVLIENTAGGDLAMARKLDAIGRLWDVIGEFDPGFCLDTCHAHAGGEELAGVADRVKAITGRIDLVHANDSKDSFDSGRDRHENFGAGNVDPADLVAVVLAAGAPVVCETPGGTQGQAADIAWLRARLPG
ncbi:MAG TPA: deoxyribonuclease IV [Sporichthyaceae bacterium]|jgi:deoxyribonuclease-4